MITTAQVVSGRPCQVIGIIVSSSLPTSRIFLADAVATVASAAASVIVRKFVSSIAKNFLRLPMICGTGLYVSLTGSAQVVTVVYQPNAYPSA